MVIEYGRQILQVTVDRSTSRDKLVECPCARWVIWWVVMVSFQVGNKRKAVKARAYSNEFAKDVAVFAK
jgi:hypothetical protein